MVLFVGAVPQEFTGLLKCCADVRKEKLPVHRAWSGRFRGKPMVAVANGAGWRRAYAAVGGPDLEAVCNIGFCGALTPALRIADIVVATAVNQQPVEQPRTTNAAFSGPLASIDHVARTVEEKSRLAATGAVGVEMEAAGALRRARELGIPFYAVRVVSDLAEETLNCDFDRVLRDDGRIDTARLAMEALRHPFTCLPELLRLGRRTARASLRLGEFLAGCEF